MEGEYQKVFPLFCLKILLTDYLKQLADSFNLLQMLNRNLFLQDIPKQNCVVSISLY
jgi:hypothetical protein